MRGLVAPKGNAARLIATSSVLPVVIQTTRLTLGLVALGLVLVIASIAVPPWIGVIFEYCATYSLIVALAVARAGVWKADPAWRSHSLIDAAKWILGLTSIATLSGLIALYARDVADVLKVAVQTFFAGLSLLAIVYLCYLFGSKEVAKNAKASKKKRRPPR